MSSPTKTGTLTRETKPFDPHKALPGLLVASSPENAGTVDRCLVRPPFIVGRGSDCSLTMNEDKISKRHFQISGTADGLFLIADLSSRNGTFVDGRQLHLEERLSDTAVIRAGQSVFVFHADARPVFEFLNSDRLGFVGRFHVGSIIQDLKEAVLSGRHLLLAGPSGAGKELTARALTRLMGKPNSPLKLVTHNAARFSSEEEAAATLFGVGTRVFSNVDERAGLIESARGGLLFIDEVHNLPKRLQRSLLRVIEDGQTARIGETKTRSSDVLFIFAANIPGPSYGLAPDLLARLRVVRVPPLTERTADIPTIFNHVLRAALSRQQLEHGPVMSLLKGDHYETLCLDGFPDDNVRGLIDLADRLATRVAAGVAPERAIGSVFSERFAASPVTERPGPRKNIQTTAAAESEGVPLKTEWASRYEAHKTIIITAFKECDGNISALERFLRARGMRCSRRWLAVFLSKWGIRTD